MIFVIEDNSIMSECIARSCKNKDVRIFSNAVLAMNAINEGELPDLIFLDVLLDGPDGFTFLNEMVSYVDTAKIPVVIVSSLNFGEKELTEYGVVGVLNKDIMTPEDIFKYAEEYAK